jgi:hypothetical protein
MRKTRKNYHRRNHKVNPFKGRRRHNLVRLHASGRRRRRNPMSLAIAPRDIFPTAASAIVGGVVTTAVPQLLLKESNVGIIGYGANAAVAIGGSMLAERYLGRNAGVGFLIGGVTMLGGRLISDLLGKTLVTYTSPLQGMGLYGKSYFAVPTVSSGPLQVTSPPQAALPPAAGVSGLGAYNRRFASRFAA